jgi:hypothetical protein
MDGTDPTTKPGDDRCVAACSLSEKELAERLAMVRRELVPHVRVSETREGGFVWELPHDDAMQRRLEDWIELERECCSGIAFALSRPTQSMLRLEVSGFPPEDLQRLQARAARGGSTRA